MAKNKCPHCGHADASGKEGDPWRCQNCDGTYVVGRSREEVGSELYRPPAEPGHKPRAGAEGEEEESEEPRRPWRPRSA